MALARGIVTGLIAGIGVLLGLAGLIYLFRYQIDCRPGQSDGQCGLGTFSAMIFAVLLSSFVSLFVGVVVSARFLEK